MSPRSLRVLARLLAPVAAITLLACADDGPGRDRLAEALIEESRGALDEDQASCVAAELEDAFGDDSYQRIIDVAGTENGTAGGDEDVRTEVIDIFSGCDALHAVLVEDR